MFTWMISCRTPHVRKAHVTLGPVDPQVGFGLCPGDELDAEYLVGGWPTPLKSDGLHQWEGWHPIYIYISIYIYMKCKIKFMFQTTNQITNPCLAENCFLVDSWSLKAWSSLPSLPRCLLKWCNYPPKQFGTLLLSWLHPSKKGMDIPQGKGWKFCAAISAIFWDFNIQKAKWLKAQSGSGIFQLFASKPNWWLARWQTRKKQMSRSCLLFQPPKFPEMFVAIRLL